MVISGRKYKHFPGLALALVVALASLRGHAAATNALAQPNIMLIVADDLGWGDLGSYGQKQIRTPQLDRLAAEGMRFTQFYAGSPAGIAARGALLTGRHTGHARIRANAAPDGGTVALRAEDLTLAEVLKPAGYFNGCIGKWGLGGRGSSGLPQHKGFDDWIGFLEQREATNAFPTTLSRHDTANLEFLRQNQGQVPVAQNVLKPNGLFVQDLFTLVATNFVRINTPDRFNLRRPFFLYLSFSLPNPNDLFQRTLTNSFAPPDDAPYSAEPWPAAERRKAALITRLDTSVGALLNLLDQLNLAEHTLVLFTSDNGPHRDNGADPAHFRSAGGLRGVKGDLFEGGVRVPFLARWPGRIPAGSVSSRPCAHWDVLPTLTAVAGSTTPERVDGVSFLPTLLGRAQTNEPATLYFETHDGLFRQAIREGEWKALRVGLDGPVSLHHLSRDPAEATDVAGEFPQIVARMKKLLDESRTESAIWPVPARR